MVFEKKQLSKVLAIALMVACAVAFMPLLNGDIFAAAKKPAKVKVKSAKQITDTMNAKIVWKKAKNAKKYNVKIDKKVVKKNFKKTKLTVKNLAEGTHKVQVQGVNGKKKGAWSKAKSFKIVAPAPAGVAVEGVTIDNATPKVGDTLTATVTPTDATDVTYQWKADGVDIAGATTATLTVTSDLAGKKITVEAKASVGDAVVSAATGAVAKVTVKAEYEKDYTAEISVGDVAKVNITPASFTEVSYQWYRGTTPIAGATAAEYTVTEDDKGSTLKCIVTITNMNGVNNTDKAIELKPSAAVGQNIRDLNLTVTAKDATAVPAIGTAYVVNVQTAEAVKAAAGVKLSATAWLDSYTGDSKVDKAAKGTTPTGSTIAKGKTLGTVSYTPAAGDMGHAVVLAITAEGYNGYVEFTISGAKKGLQDAATVVSDTGTTAYKGITTLTAAPADPAETVTYQWAVKIGAATTWTNVDGTAATYVIPADLAADAGSKVQYKVTLTGTGDYQGNVSATTDVLTVGNENAPITIASIKVQKDGEDTTTCNAGDVLTAMPSVAAAAADLDYTWYVGSVGDGNKLGTGQTYTVSADVTGNILVVAEVKETKTDNWTITNPQSGNVAVKQKLESVAMSFTNGATPGTTDYEKYDNPVVGATVTTTVAPATAPSSAYAIKYYVDNYVKDSESNIELKLTAAGKVPAEFTADGKSESLVGHKIIAVATGKANSDYEGSEVTAESGAVEAISYEIKNIAVDMTAADWTKDSTWAATQAVDGCYATVGKVLKATASDKDKVAIPEGIKYSWTIDGEAVAADSFDDLTDAQIAARKASDDTDAEALKAAYDAGVYFTVTKAYEGKTIAVTASGSAANVTGSANWNNFGVAIPSSEAAVNAAFDKVIEGKTALHFVNVSDKLYQWVPEAGAEKTFADTLVANIDPADAPTLTVGTSFAENTAAVLKALETGLQIQVNKGAIAQGDTFTLTVNGIAYTAKVSSESGGSFTMLLSK